MQVQSNTVVCSDLECIFARIVRHARCISTSKVGSNKYRGAYKSLARPPRRLLIKFTS